MKPNGTSFERETLRNLAGPDLRLQTGLAPLPGAEHLRIRGGSNLTSVTAALTSEITETFISIASFPPTHQEVELETSISFSGPSPR